VSAQVDGVTQEVTVAQLAPHDYAPTALKILQAARRVVLKKGYSALTLQAIEKESGVNRSLVHYYFGGKQGLIEALVGLFFEDPAFGYSDAIMQAPPGEERASALLDWLDRITGDPHPARLLHELLPHIVRSPKLCRYAAELYGAYRRFDGECLASDDDLASEELLDDLGALSVAIVDGLSIQSALDRKGFDQARVFALWRQVLLTYLRSRGEQAKSPEG
jgi:AcrR family transcriptional regulator